MYSKNGGEPQRAIFSALIMRAVGSISFVMWIVGWLRGETVWELFGVAAYLVSLAYLEELVHWTSRR